MRVNVRVVGCGEGLCVVECRADVCVLGCCVGVGIDACVATSRKCLESVGF